MKKEKMNIEKAINRLQWRFKNESIKINESKITINESDIQAVDFLIQWVNNQKKEVLNENELFAKLFCYAFKNELMYYNDPKFSMIKIQEQLRLPLINHYESVVELLNNIELEKYFNSLGLISKHPLLRTKEEQDFNIEIFKVNNKEISVKLLGTWTKENVFKSLNNSITELLNKYK